MPDICFYCQVHQPYRLRRFRLFDVGTGLDYFDEDLNRRLLRRVVDRCYLPTNRLLTRLIRQSEGEFRIALSLSGTLLEQLAESAPHALTSFQELVDTGGVELLAETYYHSLAGLTDLDEFEAQVRLHSEAIEHWFDRRPTVFRNTELIFSDELAPRIATLGFRGVLVEGAGQVLGWRSPNYVYESERVPGLRLLPRNFPLSDDIGFRFSDRAWSRWPLTAERHAKWIAETEGESVNIFLDYETFGEHHWDETGIFEFLDRFPAACRELGMRFVHPNELAERAPVAALSFPHPVSWADVDRGVTAWLGNRLQHAMHRRLYRLAEAVRATGDPDRLGTWRRLTTSDHLYYMCTKWFADGDVHKYFSPYETPYDAFIGYANVLSDLEQSVASGAVGEAAHGGGARPRPGPTRAMVGPRTVAASGTRPARTR